MQFLSSPSFAWFLVLLAGVLEIAWAVGLRYSEGFTRLWPSLFTLSAMGGSVLFLGLSLKYLPLGTAYAVWTGIGTLGTAALGIWLFSEPATAMRLASMTLILAGIVGLKLVS
jgi:quaternary ammonium compound-resistance protein SugE